ncbi:MAG: hypothetical protein LUG44_06455, partial [Clostridiales bacterium]|nr:hypothetical protein [Clostridiales bacterium]
SLPVTYLTSLYTLAALGRKVVFRAAKGRPYENVAVAHPGCGGVFPRITDDVLQYSQRHPAKTP